MFFSSWLQNLISTRRHGKLTGNRPLRFRPRLEALEDRTVPSTFNVTTLADVVDATDGVLSLREAILQANASAGANTIVLPAGTYTLTRAGIDEDAALSGDLDLTGHLTIQGAGAGTTIIDAAHLDRVFHVLGGVATLSDVTVQGGTTDGDGGGILNQGGQLTVSGCILAGNTAHRFGGGIANVGSNDLFGGTLTVCGSTLADNSADVGGGIANLGKMTATASIFADNLAPIYGGGLANFADLTIRDGTFAGNTAALRGGGIYNEGGNLTVSHTLLSGNSAVDGGGICNNGTYGSDAKVTIQGCTLTRNWASGHGGGIYHGADTNGGSLTITGSTFADNRADVGGGIFGEELTVRDCTFTGNSAGHYGGGIFGGYITIRDSFLAGNSAGISGGGIYAVTPTVSGCTLSGNSAGSEGGGIYSQSFLTLRESKVVGNVAALGADVFSTGLLVVSDSVIGDLYDA